jgi:hypothetical protein
MSACNGCHRHARVLHVVDKALFCDDCSEKSNEIDRQLSRTRSSDPVACDGCSDRVDFDARMAVVVRECGGAVLCDTCKPNAMAREAS